MMSIKGEESGCKCPCHVPDMGGIFHKKTDCAPVTSEDKAVKRVTNGWAVLGNHGKPMVFGSLRGREGSYTIFEKKKDATKMAKVAGSWEIKKCVITIK